MDAMEVMHRTCEALTVDAMEVTWRDFQKDPPGASDLEVLQQPSGLSRDHSADRPERSGADDVSEGPIPAPNMAREHPQMVPKNLC